MLRAGSVFRQDELDFLDFYFVFSFSPALRDRQLKERNNNVSKAHKSAYGRKFG